MTKKDKIFIQNEQDIKKNKIKNLLKNKDFKTAAIKLIILGVLFYVFYFLGQYATEKERIMPQYFQYDSLSQIIILSTIIFFFIARYKFKELKTFRINIKQALIFGFLTIVFFIIFKKFTEFSLTDKALEYYWIVLFLKYFIPTIFMGSLILSVVSWKFIKYFDNKFNKQIFYSIILAIIFKYLTVMFTRFWLIFSKVVSKAVFFLLSLNIKYVYLRFNKGVPVLGTSRFGATIYKPCSGIGGLSLFLLLFVLILLIEWKQVNKLRAFLILPIGLVGMLMTNILRIYLLFLVGIYISPSFAVGGFHSNIGWVLFVFYFLGFEYLSYDWLRKKED
ncbi:archaeosortase/exosortase family protein [Candidatus Woesearchaeota archaeon]|nr:archaeosortase/exosortase family protein [Candidatus Woesearchaeota archaeon]